MTKNNHLSVVDKQSNKAKYKQILTIISKPYNKNYTLLFYEHKTITNQLAYSDYKIT